MRKSLWFVLTLTVMGLAVAAVVLSSIPAARASGPSKTVMSNGLGASTLLIDTSNPADTVFASVSLNRTANTGYFLSYFINDQAGTFNDLGFGSIPASSVNISGGSINTGKTVVTLNVNTCRVPDFTTMSGSCGTVDITFTELPASVAGSSTVEAHIATTFPDGTRMVTNGKVVGFTAPATGTALTYRNTGGPAFGQLTEGTNVSITFSAP